MVSGDDGNYGSAAVCDIAVLQALSKRIHFGKFIAEAKFQSERERYSALIRARDCEGLMACLTKPTVEVAVLERVRLKASTYDPQRKSADGDGDIDYKVDPELIKDLPLSSGSDGARTSTTPPLGVDSGLTAARWAVEDLADPHGDDPHGDDPNYRYIAQQSATAVVDAVKVNAVGSGIFKFESSDLGIDPVAQRALFDSGLFITKEKWREVKCEAFINPKHTEWPPVNVSGASAGTSPGGKWQVFGTRESLARCGKWIDVELSMSTERVEVDTTEDAISKLYERGGGSGGGGVGGKTVVIIDAAGIGGTSSAQSLTGMQEVSGGGAAGTERDRYVQVEKTLMGPSGEDETILTFSVDGSSPGELSQALVVFQKHADAHVAAAVAELDGLLPSPATILGSFMRAPTVHDAAAFKAYADAARNDTASTSVDAATSPTRVVKTSSVSTAAGSEVEGVLSSIGFLGPAATYTHQATIKVFGGDPTAPTTEGERLAALPTIKSVFDAV
eukprot:gene9979-16379_t